MEDNIKILLEENRDVTSVNVENRLDIDISKKEKLLPNESLVDNFSLFEQYNNERDNCNNFRLILNVNPVCSNVLFNIKSEIVINEGSNSASCLNFSSNGWDKDTYAKNAVNTTNPITVVDAIKNTEYSNKDNGCFVYHCGVDIFNNHMLRNKIFMHINKTNYKEGDNKLLVYNTLADYLRDNNGNVITENIHVMYNLTDPTERHIYNTDSLYTLKMAYYNRCTEKDGWWGFTNPGMINIPTSSSRTITVNNMLSNNKPCEFIDFYPDRTLFSFTPKYNKYRGRAEKNWDYCVTYPYEKDFDLINTVCGGSNGEIKAVFKTVTNPSGIRLLQCTSLFKHNLSVGDTINVYFYVQSNLEVPNISEGNSLHVIRPHHEASSQTVSFRGGTTQGEEKKIMQKKVSSVTVVSVGDLNGRGQDRIFSIKFDDIKMIYKNLVAFGFYYKKVSNGNECSYYCRKFKKLKNQDGSDLTSDLNKAGFAKNIYGDDISQIIFTDDIDLNGLKDENGRDVSEIYLTVIKRNKGNELWYNNYNTTSEDVEFSHCFGKITTGIDFSGVDVNEEPFDYNVRYLHNINASACTTNEMKRTCSAWGETILNGMPKVIESAITIDTDVFFGDIVEFDNYNYKTTTIANVDHRFNTYQRESFNIKFRDLYQDIITSDDYDYANTPKIDENGHILQPEFTVETYFLNDVYSSMRKTSDAGSDLNLMYANISPEGYFYNPHNKIVVKDESDVLHSDSIYLNYDKVSVEGRRVIYIYEMHPEGDILVGKRYPEVDYGTPDRGEDEGNTRAATPPQITGTTAVYFTEAIEGLIIKIRVPVDYGFIKGDYVCFYDKMNQELSWGEIISFKDMTLTLMFNEDAFGGIDVLAHKGYFKPNSIGRRYFAFWTTNSVPLFAKLCLETNEFSWRNLVPLSEVERGGELYDTPFANGRLYIERNINFFLKRQDPVGEYGLSVPIFKTIDRTIPNPMTQYLINGSSGVDLTHTAIVIDNVLNTCY